jgi:hypothetical protein
VSKPRKGDEPIPDCTEHCRELLIQARNERDSMRDLARMLNDKLREME